MTSTAIASTSAVHEESYRKIGPAGRLRIALELSDLTHALAVAGMRRRYPGLNDEDAHRRLATILYSELGESLK